MVEWGHSVRPWGTGVGPRQGGTGSNICVYIYIFKYLLNSHISPEARV